MKAPPKGVVGRVQEVVPAVEPAAPVVSHHLGDRLAVGKVPVLGQEPRRGLPLPALLLLLLLLLPCVTSVVAVVPAPVAVEAPVAIEALVAVAVAVVVGVVAVLWWCG